MDGELNKAGTGRREVWTSRMAVVSAPRRVLIAHSEPNVGDSFALLLAMRGFEAVQIGEPERAVQLSSTWHPQAVFVDTRFGNAASGQARPAMPDHWFVRELRGHADTPDTPQQLVIAFAADEMRDTLQTAGYDGVCRKPCPFWWLVDVLTRFYAR
ncbi:PleD family two-component system response regulator [Caballeronia grimmiae]|uniref:response regulator n=1 Tax=Caballeronia grimmiae TaxID=1071679 RepID=UPI0038B79BD4